MNKTKMVRIFIIVNILFVLTFFSCKKDEGKGGKYSIKGTVKVRYYNNSLTEFSEEGLGADLDVFLVYGDQMGYGDKTKTDYKGEFEFKYLRSGNYKVYLYSKDTTGKSPSTEITVLQDVQLTGNKTLPTFVIAEVDKRKANEGPYTISGKLLGRFFTSDFRKFTGSQYLFDETVYLIKDGDSSLFKSEDTRIDGGFMFEKLPAGKFTVYSVSKDTTSTSLSGNVISKIHVEINNTSVDVGNLIVAKEDKTNGVGKYKISGTVKVSFCNNSFSNCGNFSLTPDYDVFIMKKGEKSYFDKVSSSINGYYEIPSLPKGTYIVYGVSRNKNVVFDASQPTYVSIEKEVTILDSDVNDINFELVD